MSAYKMGIWKKLVQGLFVLCSLYSSKTQSFFSSPPLHEKWLLHDGNNAAIIQVYPHEIVLEYNDAKVGMKIENKERVSNENEIFHLSGLKVYEYPSKWEWKAIMTAIPWIRHFHFHGISLNVTYSSPVRVDWSSHTRTGHVILQKTI